MGRSKRGGLTKSSPPLDNDRSENALRVVAMLRNSSLFSYDDESGETLASLLTVTATCMANEVEPTAYLTDVLVRRDSTPQSKIESLVPQNWQPP